jgi:ligand-binding SRPBCC domain-containing protein
LRCTACPCVGGRGSRAWETNHQFVERQLTRPYRLWHHRHDFEDLGRATRVRDHVRYALPLGPVGAFARRLVVERDLERIVDYRRQAIRRLLG